MIAIINSQVSVKEAKETVDRWYSDRQEVLSWQKKRKKEALVNGCVHTLLGRARKFPSLRNATPWHKSHIERAAINTPVQVFLFLLLQFFKLLHRPPQCVSSDFESFDREVLLMLQCVLC